MEGERSSRWRVLIGSRVVILLAFFLIPTLDEAFDDPMSWGENETLLFAKQFADPDFLAGDWYLNQPQPVRRPFHVLVYPLVETLPLPAVSLLGRIGGYLLVAWALCLIAPRIGMHAVYACVAIGLYLELGQSLPPGQEVIFKRIESKLIAYGLFFFGVYGLLVRRSWLAGLMGGLATTFHVIVGFWGSLALGLTLLTRRSYGWRDRGVAAGVWLLAAAPAIYFVLHHLGGAAEAVGSVDADWIYVYFRNPQHNDPSYWGSAAFDDLPLVGAGALGIVLMIRAAIGRDGADSATVAQVGLYSLVPYGLGLAVASAPFAAKALHYYPFRVGSAVALLFGLMIGVPFVFRWALTPRARPWAAIGLSGWFIISAADTWLGDIERHSEFPRGGLWELDETADLYEICDWIRENTEPGSLLISSPDVDPVSYLCERPLAVTFRSIPSYAPAIVEWYDRLSAFNGDRRPRRRGYSAAREIDQSFRKLSEDQYRELGRRYGGRYLLVEERSDLSLDKLFENDTWSFYALDRSTRAEAADSLR